MRTKPLFQKRQYEALLQLIYTKMKTKTDTTTGMRTGYIKVEDLIALLESDNESFKGYGFRHVIWEGLKRQYGDWNKIPIDYL